MNRSIQSDIHNKIISLVCQTLCFTTIILECPKNTRGCRFQKKLNGPWEFSSSLGALAKIRIRTDTSIISWHQRDTTEALSSYNMASFSEAATCVSKFGSISSSTIEAPQRLLLLNTLICRDLMLYKWQEIKTQNLHRRETSLLSCCPDKETDIPCFQILLPSPVRLLSWPGLELDK